MSITTDKILISHECRITRRQITLDGQAAYVPENFVNFADFSKSLYKKEGLSYPKFYKMDNLSKLGFLTAEIVLSHSRVLDHYQKEEFGMVLFNSSSSLDTDLTHQASIADRSNYFPSPSVFVYTLPNIMIGEICIRHGIKGENAFFVTEKFEPEQPLQILKSLFAMERIKACILGWVEIGTDDFESYMVVAEQEEMIVKQGKTPGEFGAFTEENLLKRYLRNR
jgi:hypothetical protein